MQTTTQRHGELAMQSLVSSLYMADDCQVVEITNRHFKQPITSMVDFESAMELLPTTILGTLYHVWHEAGPHQYIVEAYLIVKDLYQDRIRNNQ